MQEAAPTQSTDALKNNDRNEATSPSLTFFCSLPLCSRVKIQVPLAETPDPTSLGQGTPQTNVREL